MQQLTPNTLLQGGKYKIEKVLGQGGFGISYLAKQTVSIEGALGKINAEIDVTIKEFFMKQLCTRDDKTSKVTVPTQGCIEQVTEYRHKFLKEAHNLSKLHHPNIVKVVDVFEENGTAYYVMEYVDGGSLADLINVKGKLAESEALPITRNIAEALKYIHAQHMNHLDVKPGNILLRNNGDVVLIDFGLAKNYDAVGVQTTSTPLGVSVGYAPMEQYRQGGVGTFSPATDIYSLGATMYKMLTGITPPEANIVFDEGLPELPSAISDSTRKAIVKSMAPNRKARFQSIDEFLTVLNYKINPANSSQKKKFSETKTKTSVKSEETVFVKNEDAQEYQEVSDFRKGISIFFVDYVEDSAFLLKGKTLYKVKNIHQLTRSNIGTCKVFRRKVSNPIEYFKNAIKADTILAFYDKSTNSLECRYFCKEIGINVNRIIAEETIAILGRISDFIKDSVYEYRCGDLRTYCESGDGVIEIIGAKDIIKYDYKTIKRIESDNLNLDMIRGAILQYLILDQDSYFADIVVLDVTYTSYCILSTEKGKVRDSVKLIDKGITIPCKRSESIHYTGGKILLECHNHVLPIQIKELKSDDTFEAIIDINANGKDLLTVKCPKRKVNETFDIVDLYDEDLYTSNKTHINN